MDYAAASDALVAAAWRVGAVCAALTVTMVVALFLVRWRLVVREGRGRRLAERWRSRLLDAMTGDATLAPADVPRSEREAAIEAWIRLQHAIRGESQETLNRVLVESGLDVVCRRWLRMPRPVKRRLLAALALGRLGAGEDWARFSPLLDAGQSWLAIAALRGAMRIDPRRAAPRVLERLSSRPPWPRDVVRATFREAGREAVTAPLLAWIASAPAGAVAHWLPLLDTATPDAAQAALAPLLRDDAPLDLLAAAIRQADSATLLPELRALANHPAWEIRTQVASAFGRFGGIDEHPLLVRLLGDERWWVRHRAAHALIALGGRAGENLPTLLDALADDRARDALRDAAAESWLPLPDARA